MLKQFLLVPLMVLFGLQVVAQNLQEIPDLWTRVTDNTNTLSDPAKSALEQKLEVFEKEKGSQVAVLIVSTTQPETIEEYSMRVAEKWKIGRGDIDDGVILLIAKKDRKLRIEVGYGLEGAIPDAAAKRIIDEMIVPYFKYGDFENGINTGTDAIIGLVKGESLPENEILEDNAASDPFPPGWIFLLIFVTGGFIVRKFKRTGYLLGIPGFFILTFVVSIFFYDLVDSIFVSIMMIFVWLIRGAFGFIPKSKGTTIYGGYGTSSSLNSWGGSSGGGFGGGFGGGGGDFGGGGACGDW